MLSVNLMVQMWWILYNNLMIKVNLTKGSDGNNEDDFAGMDKVKCLNYAWLVCDTKIYALHTGARLSFWATSLCINKYICNHLYHLLSDSNYKFTSG